MHDGATTESGTVARTLSFEYDLANQLTEASDPAATYNYTLDNLGRVTSETQTIANFTPNIVLASTWDANNNRLSLAATLGSNADFKNEYVYDFLNRMTRVTQQGQSGGNTVATKRVDFAYNSLGQFTTIDRYQNTGGSNIVAQTTFAYDDDNRLTDLDHKQSTTTLAGYDYGYDNMGRITSINSYVEGLSTFTYDKTSQLTGADHASPRADETYTYDDNGNRTMTGYTVTGNNLTTSDGTFDYEYDDEGNRTKRTKISDGSYEVYTWDHRNRLTKITFYDSMDTVLKTVDHTYNIFNRWIRRTTDPDGPGSASAIDTFFAYDGIHAILQFDGPADTDLTNRYLFGPAVDQILASEDVTSLTSAGNILHPLSDHLGTPRDIADQNESTYTTTVTNHRTYNSFGKRTAETNAAVDFLFGETGKGFDDDTGLGNHWRRWLASEHGRWLSEDPSGFIAKDTNLSRYVGNFVSRYVDSTGLEAKDPYYPGKTKLPETEDPKDNTYDTVAVYDYKDGGDGKFAAGHAQLYAGASHLPAVLPASSKDELLKQMAEYAKKYGLIDKLYICDHGALNGTQSFGTTPLTAQDIIDLKKYMSDDPIIVLAGCCVTNDEYCQQIANGIGGYVWASNTNVYWRPPGIRSDDWDLYISTEEVYEFFDGLFLGPFIPMFIPPIGGPA